MNGFSVWKEDDFKSPILWMGMKGVSAEGRKKAGRMLNAQDQPRV